MRRRSRGRVEVSAGAPAGEDDASRTPADAAMASHVHDQRDGDQIDDERAAAERNERQRNAGHRPRRRHDADVDERLNRRSWPCSRPPGRSRSDRARRCAMRMARYAKTTNSTMTHERADQPELFAEDREDEVRVLLGQIEELRARLAQADAEEPAAARARAAIARCGSRCSARLSTDR